MVPEDAYSSSYLREEPLDKSYHFISQCASQGYHVRWAGPGQGGRGQAGGVVCGSGGVASHAALPQPQQRVPVLP